jgi:hypothetical protein
MAEIVKAATASRFIAFILSFLSCPKTGWGREVVAARRIELRTYGL